MPPRDANDPSLPGNEIDPATRAFFQKMMPHLPAGYPEFATDAYHNPNVDRFSYPSLDKDGPTDRILKAATYQTPRGIRTIHQYDPKPEFSPTGKIYSESWGPADIVEAPIVHYPISNRPRLAPQNMPDFYNNSHALGRMYLEALLKTIMGSR